MSASSWSSLGAARAAGRRPWADAERGFREQVDHPSPSAVEKISDRVVRIFAETWPALARAYPGEVERFQERLEAELAGRKYRPRRKQ